MRRILFFAIVLGISKFISASCLDVVGTTFSQTQCYESITCATSPYTYTGTFCGGLSKFSVPTVYYNCLPRPTASVTVVSSCAISLYTASLCTGGNGYLTTTILDFAYLFYTNTGTASTSCYSNLPVYYATTVIWKSGVYAGISGIAATSSNTFTSTTQTAIRTVSPTPTSEALNTSNNTVLIVVAVVVSVLVVVAAVVGFIIVRKIRATPKGSAGPSSPPSSYPPSSYPPSAVDPQQRYSSGVPLMYAPAERYTSNYVYYTPVPTQGQSTSQTYAEDVIHPAPGNTPGLVLNQGQVQGQQPGQAVYYSPNVVYAAPPQFQ
ncbi:hypothetical protein HK096_010886, partial [Nowakowskiella sp. JEL0078]